MDVMNDCMDLYSEYILLGAKRKLSTYERGVHNDLYHRILDNLSDKLKKHSG